jgi:diketogulonate reductase-like aldo/keto reductase
VLNYLYYELGVAVIPKTVNKDRLVENFSWFDFRISAEDVEKIRALDRGLRILDTRVMIGFGGVNIFA